MGNDLIDQAVFLCLQCGHIVVALGIQLDLFQRLTGVLAEHVVHLIADIYGNTINEKYTQLLKDNDTLTLEDCILLDAVQKGHRISEENVLALLNRGLLEGDTSEYSISLDLAKKTKQLPDYTRNRGLDIAKLQQMILQYLQNAGSAGAKRDAIFDYLKDVLPKTKTIERQERMVGNILVEMTEVGIIILKGRIWYME